MFQPLKTKQCDLVLGQPVDWDEAADGVCLGLPVQRTETGFQSWWKPAWRDRLAILFGRPIRLHVWGGGHPPVSIDAEKT